MAHISTHLSFVLFLGQLFPGSIASRPQEDSGSTMMSDDESTSFSVAENARFAREVRNPTTPEESDQPTAAEVSTSDQSQEIAAEKEESLKIREPGTWDALQHLRHPAQWQMVEGKWIKCLSGASASAVPFCKGVLTPHDCPAKHSEEKPADCCSKSCSEENPEYTIVGGEFKQCVSSKDTESGWIGGTVCKATRLLCCFHCQDDAGTGKQFTTNVIYPSHEILNGDGKEVMARSTCRNCLLIAEDTCSLGQPEAENGLYSSGKLYHIPQGTYASTCAAKVQEALNSPSAEKKCPDVETYDDERGSEELDECPTPTKGDSDGDRSEHDYIEDKPDWDEFVRELNETNS